MKGKEKIKWGGHTVNPIMKIYFVSSMEIKINYFKYQLIHVYDD